MSTEQEIKEEIRDCLSWNGFDEEVIDPIYQVFVSARRTELTELREELKKMSKKTCNCEEDLGYHTKECDFRPYGYNQCIADTLALVSKLLSK